MIAEDIRRAREPKGLSEYSSRNTDEAIMPASIFSLVTTLPEATSIAYFTYSRGMFLLLPQADELLIIL